MSQQQVLTATIWEVVCLKLTMGQYINIESGEDMFLDGKNVRWRKKKHSMTAREIFDRH